MTHDQVIDRAAAETRARTSAPPPPATMTIAWIKAIAHIRRASDGMVREYPTDFPAAKYGEFLWGEGNYACDCNRAIFFYSDQDDPERACGYAAFSVRIVAVDDGRELYADDDW